MIERKQIIERGHQTFHMLRTLTYLGEFKLLNSFTRLFSPWVEVPSPHQDQALRPFLLNDIETLFQQDARLFIEGHLPWSLLKPETPWSHLGRFTKVLYAGVRMSHQRKLKRSTPARAVATDLPAYFVRNFHWQIDGYLTEASAEVYDHQVEILFTGTAAAMRRLVFAPITTYLTQSTGPADILELAAGTGELSLAMARAYPQHRLTISDLSAPYLQLAQKRLRGENVNIVRSAAESLPFKEASQDIIYAIFLFHELPTKVREQVFEEVKRVLRPGGLFVVVDSIQDNDVPEYAWALKKFPKDYHEPFYQSYTRWPLTQAFKRHGLSNTGELRGFFSKAVWGHKP